MAVDMDEARQLLRKEGGHGYLVAKIERSEALVNLDRIIQASDAVMVARGDLGVEVGYAELTGLQKHIIAATRKRNRVAITATQMMESMIHNPIPTRAEVSDVANAVMDGTDAVMLSGESAVGKYPVKAVEAMSQVILGAEKYESSHSPIRHRSEGGIYEKTDEAIAMAVMYTANHLNVKAIVALTESGSTPLWMSRIRADIPIYAFTRHEATRRRVMLYRGVYPVTFDITHTDAQKVYATFSDDACNEDGRSRRSHHPDEGRVVRCIGQDELDEDPGSSGLTDRRGSAQLRHPAWPRPSLMRRSRIMRWLTSAQAGTPDASVSSRCHRASRVAVVDRARSPSDRGCCAAACRSSMAISLRLG